MASTSDKITDTRNAARPVSTTVGSTRSIGGTTLSCASLAGWPTASKVHFVTYQIDTNNNPLPNTQMDWYGIVSGSDIGSLTLVDGVSGNDIGNSVGDIVEMLPTAGWGQDLADALTAEHSRTGAHTAITAASINLTGSVTTDTIVEKTSTAGVTVDGLLIKDGTPRALDKSTLSTDSNPYKFYAYRTAAWTSTNGVVVLDTILFDTNSNFNTTTGAYTAPVSGFWMVSGTTTTGGQNDGTGYATIIEKNGTGYLQGTQIISRVTSGFGMTTNVSGIVQMSAGDTIKLYHIGGASIAGGTGAAGTFMSGFLISRT